MDCATVRPLLAIHLLQGATQEESAAIESHVAGCKACRRVLAKDRRRLRRVPRLSAYVDPPAWVKPQLMARLDRQAAAPVAPRRRSFLGSALPPVIARSGPLGLALAGLAAVVIGWNSYHTMRMNTLADQNEQLAHTVKTQWDAITLATNPKVDSVAFQGSAASPNTKGSVLVHKDRRQAVILVNHLQPPQDGQVYQLWLWHPRMGVLLPTGTFTTRPDGFGVWTFRAPLSGNTPLLFGVTREREGGSESPTSPMLFTGELPTQPDAAAVPDDMPDGVIR